MKQLKNGIEYIENKKLTDEELSMQTEEMYRKKDPYEVEDLE